MQVHGDDVAKGQDQSGCLALGRADRAEDVGRPGPLVVRRPGTCPTPRPAAGDLVLLPNSGFVSPPDLYLDARLLGFDGLQTGWKVFLKMSCSSGFWA